MSIYYSRFGLNTYADTPYFAANIPKDYPIYPTLRKCRAFRRLPPNVRKLAALAKRWAIRKYSEYPSGMRDIQEFYDRKGRELDPGTGRRLTDAEIDAEWGGGPDPSLAGLVVKDIPVPRGGFPDPDTWEAPLPPEEPDEPGPTVSQLDRWIASHGAERVMKDFGLTEDQLPTFEESQAAFREDAKTVLASPYLKSRPDDLQFLTEALGQADVYDDLGGRALELFNLAEGSLPKSVGV